jgi:hypothetical protein
MYHGLFLIKKLPFAEEKYIIIV